MADEGSRRAGGDLGSSGTGSFGDLGLDPRLVKAGTKKGWKSPTSVQEQSIPQALKGKDVVVQAPTGSGKTASYVMPMVDGLTVCRVLRAEDNRVPVLMLTARTETSDRVAGLIAQELVRSDR